MPNLREESLNAYMSLLLSEHDGIEAAAEVRTAQEAIDITVTRQNTTTSIPIFIEAKVGDSPAHRKQATQQARSRLLNHPQALAWGLCYPNSLRDGALSAGQTKQALAEAELVFAPVPRMEQAVAWRTGTVSDLVNALTHADLVQRRTTDAIEATVHKAAAILLNAGYAPALADALALPKRAEDMRAASLISALVLSNACLIHHRLRLVEALCHITTLKDAIGEPPMEGEHDPALDAIQTAWEQILQIDYHPVFMPALAALKTLDEPAAGAVRLIAENAVLYADDLAALRFDHAGTLYHRLLASAKYDGSFYTNNVSALLLARLALHEKFVRWENPDEIAKLKIIDPACGTGTLLMAAMHTARDRHIHSAETESDLLHLSLVSDSLYGLDINRHGIQLAACNLTLGAPHIDYNQMRLYTMPHGPQPDGNTKAGSLELLETANDEKDLARLVLPLPNMGSLGAEHVESDVVSSDNFNGTFDLAIMNPPFTRGDIRNRQYGDKHRRSLQEREIQIALFVGERDEMAFKAIDQNSVSTFFSPLADQLLKDDCATLAKVAPTTALINSSGITEREFLASCFQIETIVTTHDPDHVNFSENTDIHESLIIARRPQGERKPTRFISLAKMPRDAHEAMLLSDLINKGKPLGDWGTECMWSWDRIKRGDWNACQFYDGMLAEALYDLVPMVGSKLRRAGQLCKIEPGGQRIRDAFMRQAPSNAPWTVPVFWDHKTDVHVAMEVQPHVRAAPKPNKESYAKRRLLGKASRLLIANRLYPIAARTASCYATEPALGSAWVPVIPIHPNPDFEKALCAWWNSTPGILTLLHCRAKKLTYPQYSLDALRDLLIPDPNLADITPLVEAFDKTRASTLLPWPEMDNCPVRAVLDRAANQVLRMNEEVIPDWRKRITLEPTVAGKRR